MDKVWEQYMRAAFTEAQIAMDTSEDLQLGVLAAFPTGEVIDGKSEFLGRKIACTGSIDRCSKKCEEALN